MKVLSPYSKTQAIIVLLFCGLVLRGVAVAHDGCSRPRSSSRSTAEDESSNRVRSRSEYIPLTVRAPHRGQIFTTKWQSFEVVYLPQETRVYFYDYMEKPFTARGAGGEVIMQVVGKPQFFRNPLRYVPQPQGSLEQDYLAAQVDVTRVHDGDMRVYFDLVNLSYAQEPKLRFDQVFALTGGARKAPAAAFTEAQRVAPERAGSFPVTENEFEKLPDVYTARTASSTRIGAEEPRFVLPQTGFGAAPKCSKGCCK